MDHCQHPLEPEASVSVDPIFVHRRPKISDLPLSQNKRAAIDAHFHTFKKTGEFDTLRRDAFAKFDQSDAKQTLIQRLEELGESETTRNPTLLSKDRRIAAPLLEGAAERSDIYRAVETRVYWILCSVLGSEAAAGVATHGSKTDEEFREEERQYYQRRQRLIEDRLAAAKIAREAEKEKAERERCRKREEEEQRERERIEREETNRRLREEKEVERQREYEREHEERREMERRRERERLERRERRRREDEEYERERPRRYHRDSSHSRRRRSTSRHRTRSRERSRDRCRQRSRDRSRDRSRRRRRSDALNTHGSPAYVVKKSEQTAEVRISDEEALSLLLEESKALERSRQRPELERSTSLEPPARRSMIPKSIVPRDPTAQRFARLDARGKGPCCSPPSPKPEATIAGKADTPASKTDISANEDARSLRAPSIATSVRSSRPERDHDRDSRRCERSRSRATISGRSRYHHSRSPSLSQSSRYDDRRRHSSRYYDARERDRPSLYERRSSYRNYSRSTSRGRYRGRSRSPPARRRGYRGYGGSRSRSPRETDRYIPDGGSSRRARDYRSRGDIDRYIPGCCRTTGVSRDGGDKMRDRSSSRSRGSRR